MKTRLACGALLLILIACTEWGGRTMAEYQTASDTASMLADSASVMKQFEDTTNRVNFSQWNAPYGLASGLRSYLDGTRAEVQYAKILIAQAQKGSAVSTVDMFEVLVTLAHVGATCPPLAQAVGEFGHDPELGSDLMVVYGAAGKLEDELHKAVVKRITLEESVLSECLARPR